MSSSFEVDLERVAYAVAKVIASRHVAADPRLVALDPLGRASAVHEMARAMVPELADEVDAVIWELERQYAEHQNPPPVWLAEVDAAPRAANGAGR